MATLSRVLNKQTSHCEIPRKTDTNNIVIGAY